MRGERFEREGAGGAQTGRGGAQLLPAKAVPGGLQPLLPGQIRRPVPRAQLAVRGVWRHKQRVVDGHRPPAQHRGQRPQQVLGAPLLPKGKGGGGAEKVLHAGPITKKPCRGGARVARRAAQAGVPSADAAPSGWPGGAPGAGRTSWQLNSRTCRVVAGPSCAHSRAVSANHSAQASVLSAVCAPSK